MTLMSEHTWYAHHLQSFSDIHVFTAIPDFVSDHSNYKNWYEVTLTDAGLSSFGPRLQLVRAIWKAEDGGIVEEYSPTLTSILGLSQKISPEENWVPGRCCWKSHWSAAVTWPITKLAKRHNFAQKHNNSYWHIQLLDAFIWLRHQDTCTIRQATSVSDSKMSHHMVTTLMAPSHTCVFTTHKKVATFNLPQKGFLVCLLKHPNKQRFSQICRTPQHWGSVNVFFMEMAAHE